MIDLTLANDAVISAFGETPVTFFKASGVDVITTGVFDSRHFEIEVDGEVGVSEKMTTLACRRTDVEPVTITHHVLVRGVEYSIRDIRPDAEDWVVYLLRKVK